MAIDLEATERAARALLDARINSVRAVVNARQTVADLRSQLADAEREDARLYSVALRDGWSEEELRKLGIDAPDKVARVRKRATKRPSASGAPATPAPAAQAS